VPFPYLTPTVLPPEDETPQVDPGFLKRLRQSGAEFGAVQDLLSEMFPEPEAPAPYEPPQGSKGFFKGKTASGIPRWQAFLMGMNDPRAVQGVEARRLAEMRAPYEEEQEQYEEAVGERGRNIRTILPSLLKQAYTEDEEPDLPQKIQLLQALEESEWFQALDPEAQNRFREGIMGARAEQRPEKDLLRIEDEAAARARGTAAGKPAKEPGAGKAGGPAKMSPSQQFAAKRLIEYMKPDDIGETMPLDKALERVRKDVDAYNEATQYAAPPPEQEENLGYTLDVSKLSPELQTLVGESQSLQELLTTFYGLMQGGDLPEGIELRLPRAPGQQALPPPISAETGAAPGAAMSLFGPPPVGQPAAPPLQEGAPDFQRVLRALQGFRRLINQPGADVQDMRRDFQETYGIDPYALEIP
jgi:hypothetical protein